MVISRLFDAEVHAEKLLGEKDRGQKLYADRTYTGEPKLKGRLK